MTVAVFTPMHVAICSRILYQHLASAAIQIELGYMRPLLGWYIIICDGILQCVFMWVKHEKAG